MFSKPTSFFKSRQKLTQESDSAGLRLESDAFEDHHRSSKRYCDYPERLAPQSSAHVVRVDKTTVVKKGDGVRMNEAAALRLVRDRTTIPVPCVKEAYVDAKTKTGYIAMEYVEGEQLDNAWPTFNNRQKQDICLQLRGYIEQLHAIRGKRVESVTGGHLEEPFFSDNPTAFGPYHTVAQFHEGIMHALLQRDQSSWTSMVSRFIKTIPQYDICLTHGDLAPRNILVRDGKIVAILDWESCGFYPAYWEYVKAIIYNDWQSFWMAEGIVDKIMRPYLTELSYMTHVRDIMY